MKRTIIVLLWISLCTLELKAQHSYPIPSPKDEADLAWAKKPSINRIKTKLTGETAIKYFAESELFYQDNRNWALSFWKKYPKDVRSLEALCIAISNSPKYWQDPYKGAEIYVNIDRGKLPSNTLNPIDKDAIAEWEKEQPLLEKTYLSSPNITEEQKLIFKKGEIGRYLGLNQSPAYRNGKKLSIVEAVAVFERSASAALELAKLKNKPILLNDDAGIGNIKATFETLFVNDYGMSKDDIDGILKRLSASKIPQLKEWALQSASIFKLRNIPFELDFISEEGKRVNLQDLKGKVVLMDFWATWCSSCIAGMPKIKRVYDKYHDKGFEVISLAINTKEQREELLKIKEKIGFNWPLLIIGGENNADVQNSLFKGIWDKYGFSSVPQLLLIGKDGLLIEYLGKLRGSEMDIEQLILQSLKSK